MVVRFRRRSFHGESAKASISKDRGCQLVKDRHVDRPMPRKLAIDAERAIGVVVRSDEILVGSRERAVAGMELRLHLMRVGDTNILREHSVQGALQRIVRPF